jgi:hypothetical protein
MTTLNDYPHAAAASDLQIATEVRRLVGDPDVYPCRVAKWRAGTRAIKADCAAALAVVDAMRSPRRLHRGDVGGRHLVEAAMTRLGDHATLRDLAERVERICLVRTTPSMVGHWRSDNDRPRLAQASALRLIAQLGDATPSPVDWPPFVSRGRGYTRAAKPVTVEALKLEGYPMLYDIVQPADGMNATEAVTAAPEQPEQPEPADVPFIDLVTRGLTLRVRDAAGLAQLKAIVSAL